MADVLHGEGVPGSRLVPGETVRIRNVQKATMTTTVQVRNSHSFHSQWSQRLGESTRFGFQPISFPPTELVGGANMHLGLRQPAPSDLVAAGENL